MKDVAELAAPRAEARPPPGKQPGRRLLAGLLVTGALACVSWAIVRLWTEIVAAGADVVQALRTVPIIVALHLVQLLLPARAWRSLFVRVRLGLAAFFRLRLIREGMNSLLPVAHVGGEVIAVRSSAWQGWHAGTLRTAIGPSSAGEQRWMHAKRSPLAVRAAAAGACARVMQGSPVVWPCSPATLRARHPAV